MDHTSLGIASLEAMLAGKAVLSAANEMTYGPGVLKNGENVILVPREDPQHLAQTMIELLEDKQKCAAIGQRARQTIQEHFSWESVCAQTLQVYQEAIGRPEPR
jgi:glycosyltransferase involved in cell wall biosynthesis